MAPGLPEASLQALAYMGTCLPTLANHRAYWVTRDTASRLSSSQPGLLPGEVRVCPSPSLPSEITPGPPSSHNSAPRGFVAGILAGKWDAVGAECGLSVIAAQHRAALVPPRPARLTICRQSRVWLRVRAAGGVGRGGAVAHYVNVRVLPNQSGQRTMVFSLATTTACSALVVNRKQPHTLGR